QGRRRRSDSRCHGLNLPKCRSFQRCLYCPNEIKPLDNCAELVSANGKKVAAPRIRLTCRCGRRHAERARRGWRRPWPRHDLAADTGDGRVADGSFNYGGKSDKWLQGSGGVFYFILPDGSFYRWSGALNQATGTLLGTLTPTYYADPLLLVNPPAAPAVLL